MLEREIAVWSTLSREQRVTGMPFVWLPNELCYWEDEDEILAYYEHWKERRLAHQREQIEIDRQRAKLSKLDAVSRIRWLTEWQGSASYITDCAARAYFRLPMWCNGKKIPNPKAEACQLLLDRTVKYGITPQEFSIAWQSQWATSMRLAIELGTKIRIAALSHIKLTGNHATIPEILIAARDTWRDAYAFLVDDDLRAVALGFQAIKKPSSRSRQRVS